MKWYYCTIPEHLLSKTMPHSPKFENNPSFTIKENEQSSSEIPLQVNIRNTQVKHTIPIGIFSLVFHYSKPPPVLTDLYRGILTDHSAESIVEQLGEFHRLYTRQHTST